MQPRDIEIYERWMSGRSIGLLAKEYGLKKDQVRNIVNKIAKERENGKRD